VSEEFTKLITKKQNSKNVNSNSHGVEGGRGWKGNAEFMLLDITKMKSLGWKPTNYAIVECLGTISETQWSYGSDTKGGIHDP
jgi:hypothetical protein